MESLQQTKNRIKGVKNINQITKAMEMVAATKMRRSQEIALASRPYALTALDLLATLSRLADVTLPALLEKRPVKNTLIVLMTSDKGLAGSFNANVIRDFERALRREKIDLRDTRYAAIAVGQKAAAYLEKRANLRAKYVRVGDYTSIDQVQPLASELIRGFLSKDWDEVRVWSTHFKSALLQTVIERRILPVDYENLRATAREIVPEKGRFAELVRENHVPFFNGGKPEELKEYLVEPSPDVILADLAGHLVLMQIYHLILEANASEHAARRVAMKSASDNAEELAHELTLLYNKSRQAAITKELIEITAGAESLK